MLECVLSHPISSHPISISGQTSEVTKGEDCGGADFTGSRQTPGLYFEAYDSGGNNPTLGTILDTVLDPVWNGWIPDVSHQALNQNIWYSNDDAFVSEIPAFNSRDNFYMRWRGMIVIETDGSYDFKTRSDDGSFLYIDGVQIVNNDGWHGMQDRDGSATLVAGQHSITIVMNEGGGGCGLEVSWRLGGGDWERLSADVLRPPYPQPCGVNGACSDSGPNSYECA